MGVNTDPPDVQRPVIGKVQPAETQSILNRIVLRDPIGIGGEGAVALTARLHRATLGAALLRTAQHAGHPVVGEFSKVIEPCVQHGYVRLLVSDFV